jgi:hypothetical protein
MQRCDFRSYCECNCSGVCEVQNVGTFIGTGAERLIRSDMTTARYYSVGVVALLIIIFFIFVRLVEATSPAVV